MLRRARLVRHSRLSPEHETLLQALARELRVGRVCGRAAGLNPATDLLVRYDLYGKCVAYRFSQESVFTTSPGILARGFEGPFTRTILRELRAGPVREADEETRLARVKRNGHSERLGTGAFAVVSDQLTVTADTMEGSCDYASSRLGAANIGRYDRGGWALAQARVRSSRR